MPIARKAVYLFLFTIFAMPLMPIAHACPEDCYRLRLFFGLSKPNGGTVSDAEWEDFQHNTLGGAFDGFNVVDSVGYYKGERETSKIVTLILSAEDIDKAKTVASVYAKSFNQESVMLVKVPVLEWAFVGQDYGDDGSK